MKEINMSGVCVESGRGESSLKASRGQVTLHYSEMIWAASVAEA